MLPALIPLISSVLDRVLPDENSKAQATAELLKMQQQGDLQLSLAQIDVNKAEAQSSSVFVAGWRPAIGWICASAIGYQYVLHPLLTWFALNHGLSVPPSVPSDDLFELVMLMLGVAGLRSYEKIKGVTR